MLIDGRRIMDQARLIGSLDSLAPAFTIVAVMGLRTQEIGSRRRLAQRRSVFSRQGC